MSSFFSKRIVKLFAIIFIVAGFLFFQNLEVRADHTLDTSQQNNSLTANPATFTYTSGSGSTVIVLNLVVAGSTTRNGGAPTYNGVTMTQADSTRIATETNVEMWYLLNPPTGSAYTISIPNTNTRTIHAFTVTAKAQSGYTSALDVVNGATGTTADPSVAVTTTANGDFVTSVVGHGSNSITGVTGNKTQYGGVLGIDHGAYISMRMYELQASAGATTHTYTIGQDDWGMIVTAFKQVPLVTTVSDDGAPASGTVAPESGIVDLDYFTLATNIGTDTVTAVTVTLSPAGAFNNIAQVDITNNSNVAQCTAVTNPGSNTISFSGCTASVTTSPATYKVRITPKIHANMDPPSSGASYATTGTVTAFTSTNASHVLTDTSSATITIDNLSPAGTTGAGTTSGDTQVTVSWTNPSGDFSNVVVLRDTATTSISSAPTEGSSPIVGSSCGGTACQVRYISNGTSFIDTGLNNTTTYYYRIFAKDTHGNYTAYASTQQVTGTPSASAVSPTVTTPTATSITTSGATLGANVTSLGVPALLSERGICYGLSSSPTNCVSSGTTGGVFTQSVTGLTPGMLYYYRGYATNSTGTGYSSEATFTTTATASGTVSASTSTCTISSGGSTCTVPFTWSIANATSPNLFNSTTATQYSTSTSGSGLPYPITNGPNTVEARDSSAVLASTTVTGSCISGTTWSGTSCSAITHTITSSAGSHGAIVPFGAVPVADGGSQAFNITPEGGYYFATLVIDSIGISTTTPYTFTGVTGDHTISVTFEQIPTSPGSNNIVANQNPNGAVAPTGSTPVPSGGSQIYTITPDSGYDVGTLIIDSQLVSASTTYTFGNVTAPHTIEATFVALPGTTPVVAVTRRLASIIFSGKAFPGGIISIVRRELGNEIVTNQKGTADGNGFFDIRFTDLISGTHSFGLLIKDPEGRTSQTKFFLVDVNRGDEVYKNIVAPPTIDILNGQVSRGGNVKVFGYASPGHTIRVYLNDILNKEALAGRGGVYSFDIPTGALPFGQHKVRTKQINLDGGIASDFSTARTFVVSKLAIVKADLNGDEKVDIKDWSIFLARFASKDKEARKSIDLSGDGKVDISDFSIFIKTLRKK